MAYALVVLVSLVSFLNTFLGIYEFYKDDNNVIPLVVAFAVSFAVQLAIIVFGLKAGEILAEKVRGRKKASTNSPVKFRLHRYLVPYFLFLILSVFFAYASFFSFYASSSNIRQDLYAEIISQTDNELRIRETVIAIEENYDANKTEIILLLNDDIQEIMKLHHEIADRLRTEAEEEAAGEHHRANARDRFISNTRDVENVSALIRSIVDVDYESIGTVDLNIVNYFHYWRENTAHSFTTRTLYFYLPTSSELNDNDGLIVAGTIHRTQHPFAYDFSGTSDDIDSADMFRLPAGRLLDGGLDNSITGHTITLPNVDKYGLILELFSYYAELRAFVINEADVLEISHMVTDSIERDFRGLIATSAVIDGIRNNIALMYRESLDNDDTLDGASDNISVRDLSRIVDVMLNHNVFSETANAFEELHNYIETSISLYTILSRFQSDDYSSGEDNPDDVVILTIRGYANYAYSLTHSNFRLSIDVFLAGGFNVNPHRDVLRGLYSAQPMAIFLFFLCVIQDTASFFVGLTRRKAIYSFKLKSNDSSLNKLGHLAYEEILFSLFEMPTGKTERLLHDKLIFYILYGEPEFKAEEMPVTKELFDSYKNKKIQELEKVLGIEITDGSDDMAHLRMWLDNCIKNENLDTNTCLDCGKDLSGGRTCGC